MFSMNHLRRLHRPICNQLLAQTVRQYTVKGGNPNMEAFNKNALALPRWRKHWHLSMAYKQKLEGPQPKQPRSTHDNWNYEAELSAFKLRLQIDVDDEDMRAVFTQPLPEREDIVNYSEFSDKGHVFLIEFVKHYINLSFPKLPDEGKLAILDFLCDEEQLHKIAVHLGYQDFIQCTPYPPKKAVLVKSFEAGIEAIARGSGGPVAAGKFVLDFIIPHLIGKDIISDLWKPANPMAMLIAELEQQGRSAPEARLVRQSGIGTVTPIYYIALFSDKELLSESAGESVELAETDAAELVLKKLYGVDVTDRVPVMGATIDNLFLEKLFAPMMVQREQISGN